LIQIVFEAAWGGLRPHKGNMARFISSRIHYVEPIFFIKIIRWETIVAEHRLKSYSRHSIPFFTDKTTNEQSFMKTTGDVAEEVVRFIEDPTTFKYVMKEDYIDNPGS
jgi:hypothetical protein